MVDLKVHQFFDTKRVKRALARANRKALSKAGAFIRQRARTSLRYAGRMTLAEMPPEMRARYEIQGRSDRPRRLRPQRSSKPGRPPVLHMRPSPLKRLLLFAYDPVRESAVIGPLKFRRHGAPALEHGGDVDIGPRTVTIAPRPFMQPALEAEAPNLPSFYRDAVTE